MIVSMPQKSIVFHQDAISRFTIAAIIVSTFLIVFSPSSIQACSDFMFPAVLPQYGDSSTTENPVVSVRTMDFNSSSFSYFWAAPRNMAWKTDLIKNGKEWVSKYAFVSVNIGGEYVSRYYIDGMNEKGLSACTLWLDSAKNPEPSPEQRSKCISQLDAVAYILGTCSTVQEAIDTFAPAEGTPDVFVMQWDLTFHGYGINAPAHVVVHDKDNNSAVFEWVSTETFIPNVYTGETYYNSTTNDEIPNELEQLNENPVYSLLSPSNPYNYIADRYNVGGGEAGLPGNSGDFSRWLRGYYLMPNAWPNEPYACQAPWRVIQALNAMGRNDRLYGEGKEKPDVPILSWYSFTEWTLARDHTNMMLYYTCMRNQQVKQLKISEFFDVKKLTPICPLSTTYYPDEGETSPTSSTRSKHGRNLEFDVSVPEKLEGKQGNVYVYARLKDGRYATWNGAEWKLSQAPTQCPPCLSSTLEQIHMRVTLDDKVANWSDASLYAGCGESLADMFINKTYSKINIGE